MMDSRSFLHVPKSVRVASITLLIVVLTLAVCTTAYYLSLDNPKDPKYSDWILLGMSVVHMALSGFAIALLLFYTEREVGTDTLREKTAYFLDHLLPQTLAEISPDYASRGICCTVVPLGRSDIFGAGYELKSQAHSLRLWVGLNVSRIIVIYWIRVPEGEGSDSFAARLKANFHFTFGGAEKVGFSTNFESAVSPLGQPIVSIWSSVKPAENLLLQPSDRLFWMQDIAMMTASFWRTALRHQIIISSEEPSPL